MMSQWPDPPEEQWCIGQPRRLYGPNVLVTVIEMRLYVVIVPH